MLVVLGLVGSAVAVTLAAPVVLGRGTWWTRHPTLALRSWLVALALAAGALLLSVAIAATIVAVRAHTSGFGAVAAGLFAWCGLAVAGGVGALLLTTAEPLSDAARRADAAVTLLVARSAGRPRRVGAHEVVSLPVDVPLACATPDGRIVVSTVVEAAMSPQCLRAVVEHERAHVRGRHELIRRIAAVNAAAFPGLRTAQDLRRTVALLVELVADDAAARVCGPATVCNALVAMDALDPDPGLQLRAERLARVRVRTWEHRRGAVAAR